jgi:hypothetical protein
MIHQLIFAGPKPGMTVAEFQRYWVDVHAVRYASRIPQIRQYLVATREPLSVGHDMAFFEGVAEIWLANDEEQLASLQSPEFIDGARVDEPRWAAFWRTFVFEAESVTAWEQPGLPPDASLTKLYVLLKRAPGTDRSTFLAQLRGPHADRVRRLPGLRRHVIGAARDGQYGFGEPRFDAVEVWSVDDVAAIGRVIGAREFGEVETSWRGIADATARFTFVGTDHWIIRPGERPAAMPAAV